jgi:hypothetical protein
MRRFLFLLCAFLPCACRQAPSPRAVVHVAFVQHSGPVADPWSEQYDISATGVRFRRTGEPNSPINAGTWGVAVDPAALELLFARLGTVDCSRIQEVLPEEAPDGGGSASYQVQYAGGDTCSVWYRDGITYSGAEPLVGAIEEFVRGLTLPAGATVRLVSH